MRTLIFLFCGFLLLAVCLGVVRLLFSNVAGSMRLAVLAFTAEDPGGHRWTFSQTVADVDPRDWGGVLVEDTAPEAPPR
jgi:hypothetical protein